MQKWRVDNPAGKLYFYFTFTNPKNNINLNMHFIINFTEHYFSCRNPWCLAPFCDATSRLQDILPHQLLWSSASNKTTKANWNWTRNEGFDLSHVVHCEKKEGIPSGNDVQRHWARTADHSRITYSHLLHCKIVLNTEAEEVALETDIWQYHRLYGKHSREQGKAWIAVAFVILYEFTSRSCGLCRSQTPITKGK